jgi:hypothetical protein
VNWSANTDHGFLGLGDLVALKYLSLLVHGWLVKLGTSPCILVSLLYRVIRHLLSIHGVLLHRETSSDEYLSVTRFVVLWSPTARADGTSCLTNWA